MAREARIESGRIAGPAQAEGASLTGGSWLPNRSLPESPLDGLLTHSPRYLRGVTSPMPCVSWTWKVTVETYAGIGAASIASELEGHLRQADTEVDAAIGAAGDAPAILRHLDLAARHATRGHGRTAALWAVHPDEAVRKAAGDTQTRFDAWRSATFARPDLLAALDGLDLTALAAPDARFLALWKASARANGAHLDDERRAALAELQARASELNVQISQAFVADLPILELTPDELDGLPSDEIERLEAGDTPGTRRVRVEYGTVETFMTNIRRRDVRERFWRLLQDRALSATLEPMRELFRVRREIARLAGFDSWADLRTFYGALGSVDEARAVLANLAGPAASAAQAFCDAATSVLADELGGQPYQPWDQRRAVRTLGQAMGADPEALRPYLPLDAVQEGMFRLAREVFGIRVEEGQGGLGWHEDVRTLDLIDDATGELLGICLLDPWARDGKMAGTIAFMELLEADGPGPDGVMPPAVTMLVTMVPPEVGGVPATLGVFEAGVVFHEFGHVLDFTIGSRQGVVMDDGWWGQDWVEGPSFFLEYWARVPEVFATYARHPGTGAAAPANLVDRLSIAQAIEDVPYLSTYVQRGLLDLAVHGPEDVDLDSAWRDAHAANPLPDPSGAFRPFPMSMIAGGYDAALYGVPYALAIRDDLLDRFGRDGWLSPTAGRQYVDEMLRPGPFVPPTHRLASFLGHPVSSAPLAARMGRAIEAARQAAGEAG